MTTIVLVRKNKELVVASDGQVSMGNTVIKRTANKVRKIEKRNVIAGFAGSTADALTLFAVFLITVFPILTWPSPATTTSLFFLTNTIVVMGYRWILNTIVQGQG